MIQRYKLINILSGYREVAYEAKTIREAILQLVRDEGFNSIEQAAAGCCMSANEMIDEITNIVPEALTWPRP
jgi:hypothetical protein